MAQSQHVVARMMLNYLKHVDRHHSDSGLGATIDTQAGEEIVKDLRDAAIKKRLVRRIGDRIELTARGSHFLPDPTKNL